MDFTLADGVILGVLALSGVLAWSRGLTREALAIAGWVLAAVAALAVAPLLEPLLKEIPGVGPMLAASCPISKIAAFTVAFAAALLVLSIFTPLISQAIQDSILGPVDRALGFVFGVARGLVLVAVAWLVYDQVVPPADRIAVIDGARSVTMISDAAGMLRDALPDGPPDWIMAPYEGYMAECNDGPGAPGARTVAPPT